MELVKKYKILVQVFLVGVFLAVIHQWILKQVLPPNALTLFTYSTGLIYAFFTLFSMLFLGTLHFLHNKYQDQIGYVFLLATTLMMGLSYWVMLPVIKSQASTAPIEKISFYIVFIIFLIIEVIYTARLLNLKDQNN